jgi:four helix bundle protein
MQGTKKKEKSYDLETRTTEFAKIVIRLCKKLPRNPINDRLIGQLTGSAGSVGANYREANDSLGPKDFIQRLKISRREAKETIHWLELLEVANGNFTEEVSYCLSESLEIKNILSAIIRNAKVR